MARLLFLDDSETIARYSAVNLRKAFPDLQVEIAVSCSEALKKIDRQKPDLIVADRHLPDGDGCAFVNEAAARHPGIRAIIISGATCSSKSEPVVIEWLAKPFETQALVDAVRRALLRTLSTETPLSVYRPMPNSEEQASRHLILNELHSLLIGLRCLENDLRVESASSPGVHQLLEESFPRLFDRIHGLSELVKGLRSLRKDGAQ